MSYVVGYTYQADNYCDECMRKRALPMLATNGIATMYGDAGQTEDILDEWAMSTGLDRADETSFDSGDFPKVIRDESAHDLCGTTPEYPPGTCADRCGGCQAPLGHACANLECPECFGLGYRSAAPGLPYRQCWACEGAGIGVATT